MDRTLTNKVIVVTGAAEGIGYAIASSFLDQQAKVIIIVDTNEVKGVPAAVSLCTRYGAGKAVFIKGDVTKDLDAVYGKIFETNRRVDVLVNNAGIVDESSARKTLELNTISLIEWSMKFWEHMRTDKGGHGGSIVNIVSICTVIVDPYLFYYKASKFAVHGFTACLGHKENFNRFGVRLLNICPGYTYSSLTERKLCWDEQTKDFEEFVKGKIWQTADEVGKATVTAFEIGDSGSAWVINGGELSEAHTWHTG